MIYKKNENQNVTLYENQNENVTLYENQNENVGVQPKTKVMLAWSNGRETHLHPSMMHLAEERHLKQLAILKQQEKEFKLGPEGYCRKLSSEYERYSDELWQLGLRIESYRLLLYATEVLFDTYRSWIHKRHTSWYHENLKQFRRLFRRCRERAEQDTRLMPIFNSSEVKQLYERMIEEYADCSISSRDRRKDWTLWDDIYHWDGDNPLCD